MAPRPCLRCGRATTNGPRCPTCTTPRPDRRRNRGNRGRRRPWYDDPTYRAIRAELRAAGGTCPLCGEPIPPGTGDIDHVLRPRDGGTNHPDNLRLTHSSCNRRRH